MTLGGFELCASHRHDTVTHREATHLLCRERSLKPVVCSFRTPGREIATKRVALDLPRLGEESAKRSDLFEAPPEYQTFVARTLQPTARAMSCRAPHNG